MPVALTRAERKTVFWMAAGAFALAVFTILITPSKSDESYYPSSYSPSSHGGKASFLLLQQLGYHVVRWEKPLSELPESGAGSVLILARTSFRPERAQQDALRRYLATGGRVLCFGLGSEASLPHGSAEFDSTPDTEWNPRSPVQPSRITRGGPITTEAESHWVAGDSMALVHYKSDSGPIVVTYAFGKGEVVWWASATPITNAGVSRPGNLELVLNSIGDRDARVFWSEYSGSEYKSLWARAWETPVKWIFLQSSALAGLLLLTYSRRSGPVRAYAARSRLSPLEFTETLGALYKRANATGFALEATYTHFRAELASKFGIRRNAPPDALARSLKNRFASLDDRLEPTLYEVERAIHDSSLTQEKALQLVQQLQTYRAAMNVGPKQEND